MSSMRCPVLVGRREERRVLADALADATAGRGRLVAVVGEAGIGKSRLVRAAAEDAHDTGMPVLRGRWTASGGPYRALAEALLSWSDGASVLLRRPSLASFRPALARLLPDATTPLSDAPIAVMAEGILRLLGAAGEGRGCLLVLEDMHWADADSLAVIDYLADGLAAQPVLCLVTLREEDADGPDDLLAELVRRAVATRLALSPLDGFDVGDVLRACLHTDRVDPDLVQHITAAADGLPLVVEELLAAIVDGGTLSERNGHWEATGPLTADVPTTLASSVVQRIRRLEPGAVTILGIAALLGRRFPWTAVASIADVEESAVLAVLRHAIAAQLIEPTDDAQWFRFRHALTREAALTMFLPDELSVLAADAAPVIEALHPGLPGEWCGLAAELRARAGDTDRAAELLLEAARRALDVGAIATAESYLSRSKELDPDGGLDDARARCLLEVLSLAGRADECFAVGEGLLGAARAEGDLERQLTTRLRLSRAAITINRWEVAKQHLDAAAGLAAATGDAAHAVGIDALRAHVALGCGDLDDAERLARPAADRARELGLTEVACEALEVVGRCARGRGEPDAASSFAAAERLARDAGLPVWRIRALNELGTIACFELADPTQLIGARDLALDNGLLATAASLELHIAACHSVRFDTEAALDAARHCEQLARRCHLDTLAAIAIGFQGNAFAHELRLREMESMIASALELGGVAPEVVATCLGSCRGEAAVIAEKRAEALDHLGAMVRVLMDAGEVTPAPAWGLWCLLASVSGIDDLGAVALRAPRVHRLTRGLMLHAEAVQAGRCGDLTTAEERFAVGDGELAYLPWWQQLGRRLVAEAAVRHGWGTPASWAREAYLFFGERGNRPIQAACRGILEAVGEPVPRRGRGAAPVPDSLRRSRVTTREMDVLLLVGQALDNAAIAERLVLSRRTVEGHISSLLAKTGASDRSQLIAIATSA